MRGIRLWQMIFAVKRELGIFSSDKSSISHISKLAKTTANIFGQNVDVTAANKSTRYWAAATTINTVQEYRDYATSEGIGSPPTGLKIILSDLGTGGNAATPLYSKRRSSNLPQKFLEFAVGSYPPPFNQIYATLKYQVDILGSYNYGNYENFYSDAMKETFYHELTHAAHYVLLGSTWYNGFVTAEENEINYTAFNNPSASPYGLKTSPDAPIIALGESWAYHIGEYFADKKYGNSSSPYGEQLVKYSNNYISGLSSHLVALEDYDPNLLNYVFDWIPKGLYYDMLDIRNETNPVIDNVSSFTNRSFFNAFNSSITTLASYKQNLVSQNSSNPTVGQVTNLFSQYGY